jgi:hypothetical protein
VLSIYDKTPAIVQRYELGDVRRVVLFDPLCAVDELVCKNNTAIESSPSMWGFSRSFLKAEVEWNAPRRELSFSFEAGGRPSASPWQRKDSAFQTLQVVWVDNDILVTREMSKASFSSLDLYVLWKRMKPVIYNKY